MVAVSVDSPEDGAALKKKLGLEFPLLSDPDRRVVDLYGVRHPSGSPEGGDIARPATFLLDSKGVVRWRDFTDNWRIRVRPGRVIEQLERLD